MRSVAIAGIGTVVAVSLVMPWDPNASGGWGAAIVTVVCVVGALAAGRATPDASGIVVAAGFCLAALVAYSTGTYIAYELGIFGASWSDWGDLNHPISELLLAILLYGVPAAVVGATLGGLGRASRRLL